MIEFFKSGYGEIANEDEARQCTGEFATRYELDKVLVIDNT